MGRLTADPEVKTVGKENISVCHFLLAVDRRSSKDHPEADFIDCDAWRGTADFMGKYLRKGAKIAVEGELHTDVYEDKEGKKRKGYSVGVSNVEFCERKKDNGAQNDTEDDDDLPV